MSLVCVDRLRYSYPRSTRAALDDVSLAACAGEVVLLAGPSGSGKSTLLRSLTGLAPQFYGGRIAGSVRVSGMDPTSTPARRMAEVAGLLFQEPETQTIGDSVEEDVAFALEQRNEPQRVMAAKVGRCLELAGVAHLAARRVSTLSGGERQRVAIAAMLALEPRLLLLDEPSSQLDPDGEALLVENLLDLRDRTGITLLVSEHRLHRWLPAADRVLAIESGRVRRLSSQGAALLPGAPPVCELGRRLGLDPLPLTPAEARTSLSSRDRSPRLQAGPQSPSAGAELLAARGLSVELSGRKILREVSLSLGEGEIVALAGPNGSGKTTLLRALAGTVKTSRGSVRLAGHEAPASIQERTAFAALCPQDPGSILTRESVSDEIRATLRARRSRTAAPTVLQQWGLTEYAARDPRDLSTGERERAGMAAMLAHEPPVWLLDEPARGAGLAERDRLVQRLRDHATTGGGAIVATHDLEFAARFATRVAGLEAGRLIFDLPAREALGHDGPHPTQTAQVVPGALVPDEVSW